MVLGDTAQHPAVFARHPDWQAAFDIDGDAAVATRKKLFDRAAADRMLVTGYHFPVPRLRPSDQDCERLRARAGRMAAEPVKSRHQNLFPAPGTFFIEDRDFIKDHFLSMTPKRHAKTRRDVVR